MKKNYIAPSIKVRTIESQGNLMAASGFEDTLDGSGAKRQVIDPTTPQSTDGSQALTRFNVWDVYDEEAQD